MMISTKLSLQTLALVLVVFTIFSVSLTENLQLADGIAAAGARMIFELDVGESQVLQWGVINNQDHNVEVQFYTVGEGSEFLHFEEFAILEPKEFRNFDFIVVIPDDHPDNIEYHIELNALDRGVPLPKGETGVQVMMQMQQKPHILIGDNPIYTAPPVEIKSDVPMEKEPQAPPPSVIQEAPVGETLQEKLDRINQANTQPETTPEIQVSDEPEIKDDVEYMPEPVMDNEPVAEINAVDDMNGEEGGGCLIATATFGSELAPQVQLLREIRDNQLMGTGSGMAFMSGFNSLYYSFSPYIADMERESPLFKELVKFSITPMISTLSVMEHAETESEVLGLGIGVILMNLGMYVGLPTFGIVKLIQLRKN